MRKYFKEVINAVEMIGCAGLVILGWLTLILSVNFVVVSLYQKLFD